MIKLAVAAVALLVQAFAVAGSAMRQTGVRGGRYGGLTVPPFALSLSKPVLSLSKGVSFMVRQGSPEQSRRAHQERNMRSGGVQLMRFGTWRRMSRDIRKAVSTPL